MSEWISTGLSEFDKVINGLRKGDNVVWQVDNIKYYQKFVKYLVQDKLAEDKRIVYIRFADHEPLLDNDLVEDHKHIYLYKFNPDLGFENFITNIYNQINQKGSS